MPSSKPIRVGCRRSPLSQAQLRELEQLLPHQPLQSVFIDTVGDLDQKSSLRPLERTNFFTKEIDDALLEGKIDVGLHSAKDLPDPLPKGTTIAAITKGVDSRDSLVLREGLTLNEVHTVGTSSVRREEMVRELKKEVRFVDIRGNIGQRLSLIEKGEVDAVVVAEAALIRLKLTHLNRIYLQGETAPLQGQLAIVTRTDDVERQLIFAPLDVRTFKRTLYCGLNPQHYETKGQLFHYPIIAIEPLEVDLGPIDAYTHLIFTSKSAVHELMRRICSTSLKGKQILTVGEKTADALQTYGLEAHLVAQNECAEGLIEMIEKLDLKEAYLFWPHSSQARPLIAQALTQMGVRHRAIPFYQPVIQRPFAPPPLELFDEIVLTSPSCVDAFASIYAKLSPQVKSRLKTQGPITLAHLKSKLLRDKQS